MENLKNQVVLTQEDYNVLIKHVRPSNDPKQMMSLAYELGRAKVLKKETIEKERVKLNSLVKIQDLDNQRVMTFRIVAPELADVKAQKISVLTPMGSALIGFKEGDQVAWKMPAGIKKYIILDVS
ncbi:GreA/GreB family elongation factor [Olivibacter sp. XZL3]|uniref:GreA/GreB family elongation factor n=1 Tax=Olivibacter sp. XZL3 TaxID=1735116 RepID=UPI0010653E79|nr:GreA/GreB family elongation factor [Olivibacter sp. XZL3]